MAALQVAPPSLETRIVGTLQPAVGELMKTFWVATARTPGLNGSAAIVGSVPFATKYSWTVGVGNGVGTADGVAGATEGVAGVAVAADPAGPAAEGTAVAALASGVMLGCVAMVAMVDVLASSSTEPTTVTATTKLAIVPKRILR
jgi:hypothetical protein